MKIKNHCIICLVFLYGGWGWSQEAEIVEKGFDVGDGITPYNCPYNPKEVREITFVSPTVDHPYYEIVIPVGDWTGGKSAHIKEVLVGDVTCESYYVFVDGFSHIHSAWITNEKPDAKNVVLVARALWHNGEDVKVRIKVQATNKEGKTETIEKVYEGKAPDQGGGLPGWRRYQSFVVREPVGLDRENEPIEFSMTVRAENCNNLEKEMRLCLSDPETAALTPVPFQTFNAKTFPGTPPGTSNENYLQHPSKSVEVVFPATLRAWGSQVYVVFYDNPNADSLAEPKTDLQVSGPSLGATVENWFFRTKLSDKSGQIASIDLKPEHAFNSLRITDQGIQPLDKTGTTEAVKTVPRFTNSYSLALHWNPDSFSDNGKWGHTFSWDPPDETHVTTRGPLLFRITNHGRMPGYTPQVDVSVTYSFYAGVPYVLCTSVMQLREPLNASAIRNGEIVLDSHLVTHFVWKEKAGELHTVRTLHGPNWQDEWVYRVDHDVPWIAMTNELDGYGVGTAIKESFAFNPLYGEATRHRTAFYLYYHHQWHLPLTYFTRAWVYPFSDYQRGPILPVDQGSTYLDRMAFVPFLLRDSGNRYEAIDTISRKIEHPLQVRWGR